MKKITLTCRRTFTVELGHKNPVQYPKGRKFEVVNMSSDIIRLKYIGNGADDKCMAFALPWDRVINANIFNRKELFILRLKV